MHMYKSSNWEAEAARRFWKALGISHLVALVAAATIVVLLYVTIGPPGSIAAPLGVLGVTHLAGSVLGLVIGGLLAWYTKLINTA